MEAIAAVASTLQIIGQCGKCTVTIAKWIGQVKTVDARIESFSSEVSSLQSTYRTLSQSLHNPSTVKAVQLHDYDATGNLWMQITTSLRDCEKTVIAINNVLGRIESRSRIGRPVLKQLNESLSTGELVRLRQRVQLFNTGLTLPMQMITLVLQLSQRDEMNANQMQLDQRLNNLQQTLETLAAGLAQPRRTLSLGGSTLISDSSNDKAVYDNMESYIESARAFLKTASAKATTLATTSVGRGDDDHQNTTGIEIRRGSAWAPLTAAEISRIESWGQNLPEESNTHQPSDTPSLSLPLQDEAVESDDDDEIELTLARTLLHNGQNEADQENYAVAEDNFREALEILQTHDLGSNIACSPADVTLLLAQCCIKQQKYDEAITRLEPLAAMGTDLPAPSSASSISQTRGSTDKAQALYASHMLGEVYLNKSDFINAEKHTIRAHKGRKKLFGSDHPKTLESVQLAIDLYHAKGSEARSTAYKEFLKVPSNSGQPLSDLSTNVVPAISSTPESPASPVEASSTQKRRATFTIPLPFRRSEKTEPRSMATRDPRVSFPQPSGLDLSTSPGNISTFAVDPLQPPVLNSLRKSSTYSTTSSSSPTRWPSIEEEASKEIRFGRRSGSFVTTSSQTPVASRQTLEPKFLAIRSFGEEGKYRKAADMAMALFSTYDPDASILNQRSIDLEKSIRKSESKGLAGKGQGYAPIHFFCSLKQEAVAEVELLIELGADVNTVAYKAGWKSADPFTPLTAAVERGHVNLVRLLLQSGASLTVPELKPGKQTQTDRDILHPLLFSCRRGFVGIVSLLLEHGADVRDEDFRRYQWHGNSLLHEASWLCNLPMVKFLLDLQRQNHRSKLSHSAYIGQPGQQDVFGMTPLMYAIDMRDANDEGRRTHKLRHRIECLRLLLDHDGSNSPRSVSNSSSSKGEEDTEDGVVVGFMDVSKEDTGSGRLAADLHVEDKKGHSVFWYANEEGDAALTEFLDPYRQKSRLIDFE